MEPLFHNICKCDKDNQYEIAKKLMRKFPLLTSGLVFVYNIFLLIRYNLFFWSPLAGLLMLAIPAILCGAYFYVQKRNANAVLKQDFAQFHGIVEMSLTFYDSCFTSVNLLSQGTTQYRYEDITKVFQSRNLYYLILCGSIVAVLDKRSFVKGTPAEFETFIKRKAPQAKIKLK